MTKNKMLPVVLVALSIILLLSSCSIADQGVSEIIGQITNSTCKIQMTYYIAEIPVGDTSADMSVSELRELNKIYAPIMTSETIMERVAKQVGFCDAKEIRSIISVKFNRKKVLFKATFSSNVYSSDQLLSIATAYEDQVNIYIALGGGTSRIVKVDTSQIF